MKMLSASVVAVLLVVVSAASDSDKPKDLIFGVLTPKCYDTFLVDFNFFDVDCIKATISKLLSYAIILGAFALKLPQLYKIMKAKDVTGLSAISLYMDVCAFLGPPVYNILNKNAFSTYGESLIVLVENCILVCAFWYFAAPQDEKPSEKPRRPTFPIMVLIALAGVGMAVGMFFLPEELWWAMPASSVAFTIVARVPQIYQNFSQGHTGQVALLTWLLNFAGALARVFTCIQDPDISEKSRPVLIGSFAVGASLSFIVIAQVFLYWSATNKALVKHKTA